MKQDDKFIDWLERHQADADAYVSAEIVPGRQAALDEYYRRPYEGDDELKGRSTVIMSDVLEAVEWTVPQLVEMFAASGRIVRFAPRRAESVEAAEQRTEAVNYVFWTLNDGIQILSEGIRHILTQGEAAASWGIETTTQTVTESYQGITALNLQALKDDDSITVDESFEYEAPGVDEYGMPAMVPLYDVTVSREEEKKEIDIEVHDPSYLTVADGWTSNNLQKCPYVCLRRWQTLSDLAEEGYDVKDIEIDDDNPQTLQVEHTNPDGIDRANTGTWVSYEWSLYDKDGDGIAERIRSVRVGQTLLDSEKVDSVDVCQGVGVPVPGTPYGMSLKDLMGSQQLVHSTLMRILFDSAYFQTEPRLKVLCNPDGSPKADMESVLDHRSSNPIYEYERDAVTLMQQGWIGGELLPLLDYVRTNGEMSSGTSKTFRGKDADAINKTATGASLEEEGNRQRVNLMARIISETFIKPIMVGISRLLASGEMGPLSLQINGSYAEIDPSQWDDEHDMICEVGLGSGDVEQRKAVIGAVIEDQKMEIQTGGLNNTVSKKGMYNARKRWLELNNIPDAESYFIEPGGQEDKQIQQMMAEQQKNAPPPPPDPLVLVEQMKDRQKRESDAMKAQMDRERAALEAREKETQRRFEAGKQEQEHAFKLRLEDYKQDQQTLRDEMKLVAQEQSEIRQLIQRLADEAIARNERTDPSNASGTTDGVAGVSEGDEGAGDGPVPEVP